MDSLYHQCTLNWHRGVNSIPQIRSIRDTMSIIIHLDYTIHINECWALPSISIKTKINWNKKFSSSCLQNKIYFASISFLSCSRLHWRIHYKIHIFLTWLFRQSTIYSYARWDIMSLYIERVLYSWKEAHQNIEAKKRPHTANCSQPPSSIKSTLISTMLAQMRKNKIK